jgi:hypothetical protein
MKNTINNRTICEVAALVLEKIKELHWLGRGLAESLDVLIGFYERLTGRDAGVDLGIA